MYRLIRFRNTGTWLAVELLTSGRDEHDEFTEMQRLVEKGIPVMIVDDYKEYDAELVTREFE